MSSYYKDIRSTLFGIESVMVDNELLSKNISLENSDTNNTTNNIENKIDDNKDNKENHIDNEIVNSSSQELTKDLEDVENISNKDIKEEDNQNSISNNNEKINLDIIEDNENKLLKNIKLEELVLSCNKCEVSSNVTNKIYGIGNIDAELFIIGEATTIEEDKAGIPFVGEAGELLDKMLTAMSLSREQVYLTNVLKCAIPDNREATKEEVSNCLMYLKSQIQLVNPKIILVFGSNALNFLFNPTYNKYHEKIEELSVAKLNGTYLEFYGYKVMPTYCLDFLIRNPGFKKDTWHALQIIMKDLGLTRPDQSTK